MAECLEGAAKLANARGEPERAARLLGAADAQWMRLGSSPETLERQEDEELRVHLRQRLGAARLQAARREGAALDMAHVAADAWP